MQIPGEHHQRETGEMTRHSEPNEEMMSDTVPLFSAREQHHSDTENEVNTDTENYTEDSKISSDIDQESDAAGLSPQTKDLYLI